MTTGGCRLAFSLLALCSLAVFLLAGAAAGQKRQPLVYTTPPETIRGRVLFGDGEAKGEAKEETKGVEVSGQAVFTLTRAQDDDTLAGRLQVTLDEESRTKIGEEIKRAITEMPATFTLKDAVARFRPGSACPVAHIELAPLSLVSERFALRLPRLSLTIIEGRDEMTPQLCFWARQINTGKTRRGIIAAINRLIDGDAELDDPADANRAANVN